MLVVGGSRGLTGAPRMAAHASMRAGAGYVTACVPASLQAVIAGAATPELMTRGLPDNDGSLDADGVGDVLEAASARCARARPRPRTQRAGERLRPGARAQGARSRWCSTPTA